MSFLRINGLFCATSQVRPVVAVFCVGLFFLVHHPWSAAQPTRVSNPVDRAAEPDQFDLMTRWGRNVTADNAWREYPRPGMKRDRWESLNGLWDFHLGGDSQRWTGGRIENATQDPLADGIPDLPSAFDKKILVPFSPETQLSGINRSVRPQHVMFYRRSIRIPDDWRNDRILVHFEAVDWHAIVLCNGTKVADHPGGYVPFSCDITDALNDSDQQQIVVIAWDPTNMGDQTIGKQALPESRKGFRYNPNSGIWQSVWMEPVPKSASIAQLKITPVAHQNAIEVRVDTDHPANDMTVRLIAGDAAHVVDGRPGQAIRIDLDDQFQLWSPDDPNLHDLSIQLRRDDRVIDSVESYFALRTIDTQVDGDGIQRIHLNGQPIFQFGPLDQGYWPESAMTPPSEDAVRYDLQYLKDIGCNMVRVHIKVHPRAWYYEADRKGLLVWQDFVCTRKFDSKITAESGQQWEQEQVEMVRHLYNHPSIIQWVVFNEGWGQYDTERLTRWTEGLDPSRLVTCASGWTDHPVGDLYDNHDYSFNISPAHGWNFDDRATLCGECGGFNVLIDGHRWHADQTLRPVVNPAGEKGREGYANPESWKQRYQTWLTNLRLMKPHGLNAAVYTQISDVEHECNGWLTYDREISKIAADDLRRMHRQLYQPIHSDPLIDLSSKTWTDWSGKPTPRWRTANVDVSQGKVFSVRRDDSLRPQRTADKGPVRIRGEFDLSTQPERLAMHTVGTGRWELSINGKTMMNITNSDRAGYVPYSTVLLPPNAVDALVDGTNVIALKVSRFKEDEGNLVDFALLSVPRDESSVNDAK
ncbi:glycoside hydrolase family 2 protein [Crateriforma spongiae]|uniref:glycoside hydrolase family 2 protein n=1 Tax=Crateriforma spongiae TaxID=2724528 RepID=UPI0039B0CC69